MKFDAWKYPVLMIPGPSEPYPDALHVASLKVVKHYGSEWLEIYNQFLEYSLKLFGADGGYIVPFPIPASYVMEVVLNTLYEKGDNILFINDGFFVRRFKQIAMEYGYNVHHVVPKVDGGRVDIDEVELLLNSEDFKAVVAVHSETSVGILEDIEALGKVIPEDTFFIVDSVSSYGALEINVSKYGIDLCIGYSSKALGAINGVTPLYLNEKTYKYVMDRRGRKGYLNDLKTWLEYRDKWPFHPYPTTLPTHTILSFNRAAEIVLEEGLGNVEARHRRVSKYVYERIGSLGLRPKPREDARSPTVSVFLVEGFDADDIVKYLIENYNIMISTAKFAGYNAIRIGHMGYTAQFRFVDPVIRGIEEFLSKVK